MTKLQITKSLPARLSNLGPLKSKIKLQSNNRIDIISKADILYLKSDSNYCEVVLSSGEKYICSRTLKSMEEKIDSPYFFRPHQSYLVNVHYLKSVSASMIELKLHGDMTIPISRSNRSRLRGKLEVWYD